MFKINIFNAVLLLFICSQDMILAFNLSPVPNLILKMPNTKTKLPKLRSSYFGHTIVLREKSIIIAAPRAQSTLKSQAKINETGAIYKCPLYFNETDNSKQKSDCNVFPIDSTGNYYADHYLKFELKDHQWLGASMDGGSKEHDPLLICAPHFVGGYDFSQENEYFHGICYWTSNIEDDNDSQLIVKKIKALTDRAKQSYLIDGLLFWNYQLGEQGFSAHITPNNREFLMGAPGIDQWKGSVVHYDIATGKTKIPMRFLRSFSYGGYAVSSGYLDTDNRDKIIYVTTSPHSTANEFNMGEAILFDFNPEGSAIEKKAVLRGTKYGEYFGYAVIVEDVNNDDMDDLIVSAPMYALDDTIDVGAVYVFLNTGRFFFTSKTIASPFKTQARFGTTLAKLGDINRDGYPDIAIGAPFVNGHGAVAIYLGGPDGLQETPSQILGMKPPIESIMFGHGLSKGVDVDGNGFNDLAIGAPESEIVYIYRAYPVVNIRASIKPQKPRLELNETELEVEFCFQMETESIIMKYLEVRLEIEVDPKIRRITFRENNDNRFDLKMNATKDKECQSFVSVVKFLPVFIFTPMELVLRYGLVHDAQKNGNKEFCSNCAVLEPTSRREVRSRVTYEHGCKGTICKVDLKITALKMPENFTLGSSNILYVEYFVENLGEKAFDTKIEISTSMNISHAKIPSNCMEDTEDGNKLICSLFFRLGFTGNTTIEIGFDMSHVSRVPQMNITAKALSGGHEIEPKDNILNSTVEFFSLSALEIVGISNETFISILEKSKNFDIFYSFKLQNNGPSTLYNIDLWLLVPSAHIDSKNVTINFLKQDTSQASALVKENDLPTAVFKMENSTSEIIAQANKSIIQQKIHMVQQLLPKNTTLSLNMNTTNDQNFASAHITNIILEVGQHIEIDVVLNIDPKLVKKLLKKRFDYLEMFMEIAVESLSREHVNLNITKILSPIIMVNIAPITPIWVYIISVIGGLMLVTLMTLGLRRLGFFKRQTKEDMEEIINEKLEKARMKAELELEISKNDLI